MKGKIKAPEPALNKKGLLFYFKLKEILPEAVDLIEVDVFLRRLQSTPIEAKQKRKIIRAIKKTLKKAKF